MVNGEATPPHNHGDRSGRRTGSCRRPSLVAFSFGNPRHHRVRLHLRIPPVLARFTKAPLRLSASTECDLATVCVDVEGATRRFCATACRATKRRISRACSGATEPLSLKIRRKPPQINARHVAPNSQSNGMLSGSSDYQIDPPRGSSYSLT